VNLALRIGWREIRRTPGRSALALFLIMLPVIGVTAADVLQATASVNASESMPRRLGTAQAQLQWTGSVIDQWVDPQDGYNGGRSTGSEPTPARLETLVGGRPTTSVVHYAASVRTKYGVRTSSALMLDMTNPLTRGLFRLTSGKLPAKVGEVAVNAAYGSRVGTTLTQADGSKLIVTGTVESAGNRSMPMLFARPGTFPTKGIDVGPVSTLVGGAPVTWSDVRRLNQAGFTVLSRSVVEHPPPTSLVPPSVRSLVDQGPNPLLPVLALVAAMVLIEVVLLAGPAFAVGARQRARMLALVAANGGTPRQARRIVLATALLLGAMASLAGVVAGVGLARALQPLLQQNSTNWFGPFQIRWSHLAVVVGFGLLSALLAAVVPAWTASRQDVVTVLSNRRDPAKSRRSLPLLGLLVLGAGVAGAAWGAHGGNTYAIAAAAVLSVGGMVLCVPAVVALLASLSTRLPLALRFALRDAGRNRVRTVPAIAAVAATVAGTVALLIANTTDQTQARRHYEPNLPVGSVAFTYDSGKGDWAALARTVKTVVPSAELTTLEGVRRLHVAAPTQPALGQISMSNLLGTGVLVDSPGARAMVLPLLKLSAAQRQAVERTLGAGGIVVVTDRPRTDTTATVKFGAHSAVVPATYVPVGTRMSDANALVSRAALNRVGAVPATTALAALPGSVPGHDEDRVTEAVHGIRDTAYASFEHGYQTNSTQRVVMWILFVLAGVLMLGGTLSATFLALSDAQPDLATLAAVGAEPRARRAIATGYAAAVAVVGAVLGMVVGAIPGVAITYPLGRGYDDPGHDHLVVIPWLPLSALLIGLPLLTMLVVAACSRSRLPMVARAQ